VDSGERDKVCLMKRSDTADQARRILDARLEDATVEGIRVRPRAGWIRAIRSALGMSQAALGSRLGVTQAAVGQLENAERHEAITLSKLSEVARALDCQLVYALVPNSSLEDTVQRQARNLVASRARYVGATMALEDQALSPSQHDQVLGRQLDEAIESGDLWRQ
jgi:predicted DNA-binding mobile mystery protein A